MRPRTAMAVVCTLQGFSAWSVTAPRVDAKDTTLIGTLHVVWDADETADNPEGVLVHVVDEAGRGTPLVLEGGDALRELRSWDRRRIDGNRPGRIGGSPVSPAGVSPLEAVASAGPGVDEWDFITLPGEAFEWVPDEGGYYRVRLLEEDGAGGVLYEGVGLDVSPVTDSPSI